MSGNICRCAAYPNIVAAIPVGPRSRRMMPFTYERATDAANAARPRRSPEPSSLLAASTCSDLMKLEIERPAHLVDITRLPLRQIETAGDGVRIGSQSQQRSGRASTDSRTLSCALHGIARGRIWTAAKQGIDRRQPAAADPLLHFYDTSKAGTSASPARGARRCRVSIAFTRFWAPAIRVSPCTPRHGRGIGGARRVHRNSARPMARSAHCPSTSCIDCRGRRRNGDHAAPR